MSATDGSDGVPTAPELPRTLRDAAATARRRALLHLPHVAPLGAYAAALRQRDGVSVPEFDPLDGGTTAEMLFLLEKPGPMTEATRTGRRAGSGFISRDNDDPTAEATFRFMSEAGIARQRTVLWNVIPWWNGTIRVTTAEHREGLGVLGELLRLLPRLRAVVLVGRRAGLARPAVKAAGLRAFVSDHPSPQVRAAWPQRWAAIPDSWRKAAQAGGAANGTGVPTSRG